MRQGTSAEVDEFIAQATQFRRKLTDLAQLAVEQGGFGEDDGWLGLTYPHDLDDYARKVEKECIPDGWVEIYGCGGGRGRGGYEFQVEEKTYLVSLARILREAGLQTEALQVERLFRLA